MRPVRKLKRTLKKEDSVQPLLQQEMMQEAEDDIQLEEAPSLASQSDSQTSRANSRKLVLTNVPWKSWIPRLGVGIGLMLGALLILGLRPVFWNIALVMAILGVFFVYKTKAETYVFDMDTLKFTWQRRSLFSLKRREFWLHDIQAVRLVELSDGQGGLDSNLYLVMSDGSRLKIYSGQLITLKDRSRVLAKQAIEAFLAAADDGPGPHSATESVPSPSASSATKMQRRLTAVLSRGSSIRPRRLDVSDDRAASSNSVGNMNNSNISNNNSDLV